MTRVRIREQQVELARAQLSLERRALVSNLAFEVGIVFGKLLELAEVSGAAFQAVPRRDEVTVLGSLSRQLAGATWVVPRTWLRQLGV